MPEQDDSLSVRPRTESGFYYRLDISTSMPLGPGIEPDAEYTVHASGRIVCVEFDVEGFADAGETAVGRINAYVVDVERARQDGEDPWDVLDADAFTADYMTLIDHDTGRLRHQGFEDDFAVSRLLIIDRVEVLPAHRRKGLGMWAVYRIIDILGGTLSVLPVMQVVPLQFVGSPADRDTTDDPMCYADMSQDEEGAYLRLAGYWQRMGWEMVFGRDLRGGAIWALRPSRVVPSRRDALGTNYDPSF